ncbi:MAG: GGDEF domain-containing protein [Candidatus Vogelbacteria bacterium]|nr:GGDEF domain-containing protein [Candidatus Vogelbacteria bacterium]
MPSFESLSLGQEKPESPEISAVELEKLKEEIEQKNAQILKMQETIDRLEKDLIHDSLTGLKTKNFLSVSVREALATMASPEQEKRRNPHESISLVFCDIDNFKKLNDTYGHAFGDTVLKAVAQVLKDNVRDTDIAARYGGEEMVLGLLGANSAEAFKKAEEIREKVEALQFAEQPDLVVTMSLGVSSSLPGQNLDVETLIKQADEAMYQAKNSGKNNVKVFA